MTTSPRSRAAALRAAGLVLLELLPYALVGVGAGLVFLPAGFLAPGVLWWVADRLDARGDAAAPAAPPSAAHDGGPDVHA